MRYLFSIVVLALAIITIAAAMVNFPPPVSSLQRLKNEVKALPDKVSKDLKETGSELEKSVRKWIDEAGVVNYTDSKYVPADAQAEGVDTTVAAEIPAENISSETGVKKLR